MTTAGLPIDQAVVKVRSELPAARQLGDGEIAATIYEWGAIRNVPIQPASGASGKQPLVPPPINTAQRLMAAVEAAIPGSKPKAEKRGLDWNISAGGAEAMLRGTSGVLKAGLSPTLTLGLEAAYKGMTFRTELASDKWSVLLAFPGNTMEPDIGLLQQLFADAWGALGKLRDDVSGLGNWNDVDAVKKKAKPHVEKLSNAWDAFKGAAAQPPPGGFTFGIRIAGPIGKDSGVPGVSAAGTMTIFF
jgi:hypothetical protein